MDKYTITLEDLETRKTITIEYEPGTQDTYGELDRVVRLLRTLLPAVTTMHWYLTVNDPSGGLADFYFWDDIDEAVFDEIKIDDDTVDALGQLKTLLDGRNGPQEPA